MDVNVASLAYSHLEGSLPWGPAQLRWSVKTAQEHAGLERGEPPLGLLHPDEQRHLDKLCIPKRRCDWLVGRWTAKHLLQATLREGAGVWLPLDRLIVANDSSGAPYARLASGEDHVLQDRLGAWSHDQRLPLSLSISHSGQYAFCAVGAQFPLSLVGEGGAPASLCCVGADIERIETRDWAFVLDYFTPAEIRQVRQAPPELRDIWVTTIWSAKEAVLKTLQLGLTVDTRWVSIHLHDDPLGHPALDDWAPFQVTCDQRLLPTFGGAMVGWRRQIENFVLTVAVSSDM